MIHERYHPVIAGVALVLALLLTLGLLRAGDSSSGVYKAYEAGFDPDTVMEVQILVDEEDWQEMIENATDEEYISAQVIIDGENLGTVGIRPKGNSSLSQVASDPDGVRFSYKIKFDQYTSGNSWGGLDKLVLNNMHADPTYMKEYLSYELLEKMGIAVPLYRFAHITVNGEEWGLYLALEPLEEDYLERNFGYDYGNLYKVETADMGGGPGGNTGEAPERPEGDWQPPEQVSPPTEPGDRSEDPPAAAPETMDPAGEEAAEELPDRESGGGDRGGRGGPGGMGSSGGSLVYTDDDIDSYSDIFTKTITDETDGSDKERLIRILKRLSEGGDLEDCIDVDEVLRYLAVNTYLVNLDSYAGSMKHNYYLYEKDGVMSILPSDYNLSFGAFQSGDSSQIVNFPIDEPVTDTMENSPLISVLLANDEYRERYHGYLRQLAEEYAVSGYLEQRIDQLNALIGSYVEADATAFYTYEEYQASLTALKTLCRERGEAVLAQLNGEQPADSYGDYPATFDLSALGGQGGGGPGGGRGERQQGPGEDPAGEQPAPDAGTEAPPQDGENTGVRGLMTNAEPPEDTSGEGAESGEWVIPLQTPDDAQEGSPAQADGADFSDEHRREQTAGPQGRNGRPGGASGTLETQSSSVWIIAGCLAGVLTGCAAVKGYHRRRWRRR